MTFGIEISGMKSYNMDDARPLTFLGTLSIGADMGNINSSSGNYSSLCPAGSQLVCIPDNAIAIIGSSVSPAMQFKSLDIGIDNNARTVSVTLDLRTNLQSPVFRSSAADRPKSVNVYCVYPPVVNLGGFGFEVSQGGSFPYVVDSSRGMFLTYTYNGIFNGNLQLPISTPSNVFCYWDHPEVAIYFEESTKTIRGYSSGGNQSGISINIQVCAFSMKSPTVPDWGIQVYGLDGKTSFTSEEMPIVYRGAINSPGRGGATTYFSNQDQANRPMIPVLKIGGQLISKSWFHLGMARSGNAFFGRPAGFINGGDNNNQDQQVVGYESKSLPFIYASDYF